MKKLILSICALVLMSVFHISCNKDDFQPNKKEGTVEFGFALKAPSNSGAQKSSMKALAAEPAAVVVSIKKANGNSAYTMERVDLYNMNGYYISKPLSLLPGSYTVEQFFVVDAAGSVMYASPVQGSPKAYLVSKPLPISFAVGKDVVTKVVPEVLSTANSTPEDFGYTTFSFDVVKTFDFLIGVFVYNESVQNFEMTSAHLTVAAASKTIYTDTLAAITNQVTLNDGYGSYLLTVTKDGYKTWTDTLTAAELKLYFRSEDKGPLEVILERGGNSIESIWFITDQTTLKKVELWFEWNNSDASIDWGDGYSSKTINYVMNHKYLTTGIYKVVISGNIQNLTSINVLRNQITAIDVSNAYNLENLSFIENRVSNIDVSHNLKLKGLVVWGNPNLESIDISMLKDLESFYGENCNLTVFDVTNNTKLVELSVAYNENLKQMDLSNNHMIRYLFLSGKDFKTLDCTNFPYLNMLQVYETGILSLNLSQNPNLQWLHIEDSPVTALDISYNKKIEDLELFRLTFNQEAINNAYLELYANVTQTGFKNGRFRHDINIVPTGQAIAARDSLVNVYNWRINP